MSETLPEREQAWALLCEWTLGDSLRKHARAVEYDEHCAFVIASLREIQEELGLKRA